MGIKVSASADLMLAVSLREMYDGEITDLYSTRALTNVHECPCSDTFTRSCIVFLSHVEWSLPGGSSPSLGLDRQMRGPKMRQLQDWNRTANANKEAVSL